MSEKLLVILLLGPVLGPGLSLFVTPIFVFLRKLFYVPLARKKMVAQAAAKGHQVTANLVRSHEKVMGEAGGPIYYSNTEYGIYQYEYNGRKYTYRAATSMNLSDHIVLYFDKKPRKACLPSEFGLSETRWIKYFVMISCIMCVLVWIVGIGYVDNL